MSKKSYEYGAVASPLAAGEIAVLYSGAIPPPFLSYRLVDAMRVYQ